MAVSDKLIIPEKYRERLQPEVYDDCDTDEEVLKRNLKHNIKTLHRASKKRSLIN